MFAILVSKKEFFKDMHWIDTSEALVNEEKLSHSKTRANAWVYLSWYDLYISEIWLKTGNYNEQNLCCNYATNVILSFLHISPHIFSILKPNTMDHDNTKRNTTIDNKYIRFTRHSH